MVVFLLVSLQHQPKGTLQKDTQRTCLVLRHSWFVKYVTVLLLVLLGLRVPELYLQCRTPPQRQRLKRRLRLFPNSGADLKSKKPAKVRRLQHDLKPGP